MTGNGSNMYSQLVIPLLAEFTTLFLHTFWGVMASGPYVPPTNSSSTDDGSNKYLEQVFAPALQAGLSVWMQIVVFWKISVVHFNPAVSIGFLVSGHLRPIMFVPYVAVQCLAAIIASFTAKLTLGQNPAVIVIGDDISSAGLFFNEAIMTGALMFFAVAMVMDESYDQATGPLAIGFTVFQGILSAWWVGTVCMNPARAFGPAVITGEEGWNRHWLFWVSDLTGAVISSGFYMMFFAPKSKRWILKLRKQNENQDDVLSKDFDGKDSLINETNI